MNLRCGILLLTAPDWGFILYYNAHTKTLPTRKR